MSTAASKLARFKYSRAGGYTQLTLLKFSERRGFKLMYKERRRNCATIYKYVYSQCRDNKNRFLGGVPDELKIREQQHQLTRHNASLPLGHKLSRVFRLLNMHHHLYSTVARWQPVRNFIYETSISPLLKKCLRCRIGKLIRLCRESEN